MYKKIESKNKNTTNIIDYVQNNKIALIKYIQEHFSKSINTGKAIYF